jgi:5-formyltetrahydrofolate cyclo-ligase
VNKDVLRRQIRLALKEMTDAQRAEQSAAVARQVIALEEFQAADPIFLYVAIGLEVATASVAEAAWRAGKTVLVPRVDWKRRRMDAIPCRSLDEGLVEGRYGLLEPAAGEPVDPETIELIVVPGLAFDRRGRRLGRGGGFYDRFLAQPGCTALRVGVAFDQQLTETIPTDAHDQPVDLLVTDQTVLRFQTAADGSRQDPAGKE